MKMLLCTYFFSPQNEIAAIRLSKIVKYLVRHGWEIDVLCFEPNKYMPLESREDKTLICEEINKCNVLRIAQPFLSNVIYYLNSKINNNKTATKVSLETDKVITIPKTSSLLFLKDYLIGVSQALAYAKAAKRLTDKKYDICMTSFGPISSLLVCKSIKKAFSKARLVIDFRDPFIRQSDYLNRFVLRKKKGVLKSAYKYTDNVIAVSDGCIFSGIIDTSKVFYLSNGYDLEDRSGTKETKYSEHDNKLHIFYGGRVYYYYKPDLLAEAICLLPENIKERIVIHYAGKDFALFSAPFVKNKVDFVLEDCGILLREKVLKMQEKCDFLLCMTWNTDSIKGVVTAKVLEYLSASVPIICLISGNEANGATETIISECNVGECFYSYQDDSAKQLAVFLQKQFREKYMFSPNVAKINEFSYEKIAEKFILFFK